MIKTVNRENLPNTVQKTMCISTTSPNSKFYKDVLVNNVPFKAFVDLGSEASLISKSSLKILGLECNNARL